MPILLGCGMPLIIQKLNLVHCLLRFLWISTSIPTATTAMKPITDVLVSGTLTGATGIALAIVVASRRAVDVARIFMILCFTDLKQFYIRMFRCFCQLRLGLKNFLVLLEPVVADYLAH